VFPFGPAFQNGSMRSRLVLGGAFGISLLFACTSWSWFSTFSRDSFFFLVFHPGSCSTDPPHLVRFLSVLSFFSSNVPQHVFFLELCQCANELSSLPKLQHPRPDCNYFPFRAFWSLMLSLHFDAPRRTEAFVPSPVYCPTMFILVSSVSLRPPPDFFLRLFPSFQPNR